MQISRAATFQSLSLIAILLYLVMMMSATRVLEIVGVGWIRAAQLGLIGSMTAAACILLPSSKARAWLRVVLAKHFFEHRYDYRAEWLGFTKTIGQGGGDAAPLRERIIKALADIGGAPAGLLLSLDEQARLVESASWNWPCPIDRSGASEREFVRFLEATGHVIDFEAAKGGLIAAKGEQVGFRSGSNAAAPGPAFRFSTRTSLSAWCCSPTPWCAGRSTGRISTCSARPARKLRATSRKHAARKRWPTCSASTSSTGASPSSCTTSRTWSASSVSSPAMPSGTPTIPNFAPT
jgi:hypothetical protein